MTIAELAWMAGIIDGEGYIGIGKQVRKNRPNPKYSPYISISNTNTNLLLPFVNRYGSRIYHYEEKRADKRHIKWADIYHWYCPINQCKPLLTDILPHLRGKSAQANLVLEFLEKRDKLRAQNRQSLGSGYSGLFGSMPMTTEELNLREDFYTRAKMLNTKGQTYRMSLAVKVVGGGGQ